MTSIIDLAVFEIPFHQSRDYSLVSISCAAYLLMGLPFNFLEILLGFVGNKLPAAQ